MEGPADERGDLENELQTTSLCGHSSDSMPELAAVNDSSSDESSGEHADRPRPPPRQSPQPKKPVKKKPAKKKPKRRKAAKRRGGQPGARVYMHDVHTSRRLTTGGDQEEPGEARFAELRKAIEASPKKWGDGSGGVSTFDLGRMFSTSLNFQESQWVNHDEGRPKRTDGP